MPKVDLPLPPIDQLSTTVAPSDPTAGRVTTNIQSIGPALPPSGVIGGPAGVGGPPGEAIEARYVEKPPRLLRSEQPRFPDALRAYPGMTPAV